MAHDRTSGHDDGIHEVYGYLYYAPYAEPFNSWGCAAEGVEQIGRVASPTSYIAAYAGERLGRPTVVWYQTDGRLNSQRFTTYTFEDTDLAIAGMEHIASFPRWPRRKPRNSLSDWALHGLVDVVNLGVLRPWFYTDQPTDAEIRRGTMAPDYSVPKVAVDQHAAVICQGEQPYNIITSRKFWDEDTSSYRFKVVEERLGVACLAIIQEPTSPPESPMAPPPLVTHVYWSDGRWNRLEPDLMATDEDEGPRRLPLNRILFATEGTWDRNPGNTCRPFTYEDLVEAREWPKEQEG